MSQSAERTLQLLSAVARSTTPLGLMDLVGLTGLDKSTAARLIGRLERMEFVRRDPLTRKFVVGPALRALAATALFNSPLVRVVRPYLERLRDESGETAFLHMRVRDERVCLDSVESGSEIRQVSTVGELQPLYAVPSGKVIMAFLDGAERARLLDLAEREGYDRARVEAQLRAVRDRGFLALEEDKTPDVAAVSVPVFDAAGANYSITVAGPRERWTAARRLELAPSLVRAADSVSLALGGASRAAEGVA